MSTRASLLPKYSTMTALAGTVNAAANLGATGAYVFGNREHITGYGRVIPATVAVSGSVINTLAQVHHTLSVLGCNSINDQRMREREGGI